MRTSWQLCLLAVTALSLAPGQKPQPVAPVTFTITDSQDGDFLDGLGWTSTATSTYRICSTWSALAGEPPPGVVAVMAQEGLEVSDLRTMLGATPREGFARRGSLLAMLPGERLPFYVAELSGTSDEKKSNAHGSVRTIGDGVFEHKTGSSTYVQRNMEGFAESAVGDAEFIRTEKGGILWFGQGTVPAAGLTDFMGAVTLSADDPGWRSVFVFTFTNEELGRWQTISKTNHGVVRNDDGQSIDYKATLSVSQPVSVAEVDVTVGKEYRDWRPQGNIASPDKPGNSLAVTAAAHASGDPGKSVPVKMVFTLVNVSEEKGVCTNHPLENGSTDPDLKFRKEDFGGEDNPLEFVDEKTVRSKKRVEQATVTVQVYDFGAYGTLRVTAKDDAGNEQNVRVLGEEKTDLSIPRDDNSNRISDSWEDRFGLGSAAADMDEDDRPAVGDGQYRGDGLSLYEEYRGFKIKSQWHDTDPRAMDLFIHDETGKADAGVQLFKSATGIEAHLVFRNELVSGGGDYVVNPNAGDTKIVAQHGVLIVACGACDPEAVGSTPNGTFGPPRFTKHVRIPSAGDYSSGDRQADIAHEICHAVGIAHHGDGISPRFWKWKEENGGWQMYEQRISTDDSGQPVWEANATGDPVQVFFEKDLHQLRHGESLPGHFVYDKTHDGWLLYLGEKHSEFAGDQECLLRYYDKQAYRSDADRDGALYSR